MIHSPEEKLNEKHLQVNIGRPTGSHVFCNDVTKSKEFKRHLDVYRCVCILNPFVPSSAVTTACLKYVTIHLS